MVSVQGQIQRPVQKKVGSETDLPTHKHVINDKVALQSSDERREFSISEF